MSAKYVVKLVRLLIGQRNWTDLKAPKKIKPLAMVTAWLEDPAIRDFLKINTFNDTEWFNWESMELWLHWMRVIGLLDILVDDRIKSQEKSGQLVDLQKLIEAIEKALSRSDYQVEKLLENLKG
jgi:hypothetical protein